MLYRRVRGEPDDPDYEGFEERAWAHLDQALDALELALPAVLAEQARANEWVLEAWREQLRGGGAS